MCFRASRELDLDGASAGGAQPDAGRALVGCPEAERSELETELRRSTRTSEDHEGAGGAYRRCLEDHIGGIEAVRVNDGSAIKGERFLVTGAH